MWLSGAASDYGHMAPTALVTAVRRLRAAFAVLALLPALVTAAVAYASSSPAPKPWPHPVRVYNPTGWQIAVSSAIDAWNRAGTDARFLLVDSAVDADVIIVASHELLEAVCPEDYDCIGYASQIGYKPGASAPARLYLPSAPTKEPRGPAMTTATVAHELGHILGLVHRDGCSIMNSEVLQRSCDQKQLYPALDAFLCGPMPEDVDEIAARYGGRRNPAYTPECVKR